MSRLAMLAMLLAGCILDEEDPYGLPTELSNLACTPMSLTAEPYHLDCTVDLYDPDGDALDVYFRVFRAGYGTATSGRRDIPSTGPCCPKRATVQVSFDLPPPITAGDYTLEVEVSDLDYGRADTIDLIISVQ